MGLRYSDEDLPYLQHKVWFVALTILLFLVTVGSRLYYLQIYRGKSYRLISEQTSVREQEVRARRGRILDRGGRVLASSRAYFEIVAIPQKLVDRNRAFIDLAGLIGESYESIRTKYEEKRVGAPPFMPIPLIEDVSFDSVALVLEQHRRDYNPDRSPYLDGIEVRADSLRVYHYPELFSHALGYLKEIDKTELTTMESIFPAKYSLGDMIGANGLEGAYDVALRGQDGVMARVVDARGRSVTGDVDLAILAERASQEPIPGFDLMTTLDLDVQIAAERAMNARRGAVVAMIPQNGEILTLYSSPGYNANRITKNIDKLYWQMINLHEDKFLYNRAVQAAYPPGSIFKPVTALAGLMEEKITIETSFYCGGGMQFGSRRFKCWNAGGHGRVALNKGLAQSCDVYFYNVGLKAGVDGIHRHALTYGLGQKTGIEIAYENKGLIPSSEWKQKRYQQEWIESETLSVAIGQGYDLVTPVQAAKMVAMIANGGRSIVPHMGRTVSDRETGVQSPIEFETGEPVIQAEFLAVIQQGLIDVVHGAGTAKRLRQSPYKIAGKTGTAQVIGHDSGAKQTERTKPHGWFIAYAPYDDPKIAVSVIVENGGGGSSAAAPVAMEVINAYLGKIMPIEPKDPKPHKEAS